MAHADLFTRCTACLGEIRIARDAAQHGRQIVCGHCGTPAYIWQLIGRANREEVVAVIDDYAPQFPRAPFAESPGWEAA